MKVEFMKFVDEYAGRAIVFLLKLICREPSNRPVNINDKNLNFLFIKFWGIGSISLSAPALSDLREKFPNAKFYYLTLNTNKGICREINNIDEILCISIDSLFSIMRHTIKAVRKLSKINFDCVYDFEFYTYFSACIVRLLKSKYSIGFDNLRSKRKKMFAKTISFNESLHTVDNFRNLVNEDNFHAGNRSIYNNYFRNQTRELNKRYIVVNPNASRLAYERRLPLTYYAEIIKCIDSRYGIDVKIIGSADEIEYTGTLYGMLNDVDRLENLCGKTSSAELINLIASAKCLITNDSGPLHIASLLNIPSVSFFGPESPVRYGPLSDRNIVFYENLKCSPCMSISNLKTVNCIFDSAKCMEMFKLPSVLEEIICFLDEILSVNSSDKSHHAGSQSKQEIGQGIFNFKF